jgi:putative peptide zinc metalloprotease protein
MDSLGALPLQPGPLVTDASRVRLHAYFARPEGPEYVVGRQETSVYLAVPPLGVQAMALLDQGLTVGAAAARLVDDEGVVPDLVDFVHTLIGYGLVAEVDGHPVGVGVANTAPARGDGLELFRRLRSRHVRWLISPVALGVHATAVVAVVLLLWRHPEHVPASEDFFAHPWYTVNILILAATGLATLLAHELGHLFAARAYGLTGRIGLGRRLRDVVLQCTVPDIWRVPRAQRVVVYVAGMLVDVWILLVGLVTLIWAGAELSAAVVAWIQLVLVLQWTAIAWQLNFYLEVDGYYIIAELFSAKRLLQDTRAYLRHLVAKVAPRLGPGSGLAHLAPRERRVVYAYVPFYLVGVAISLGVFVFYVLPFAVTMAAGAVAVLAMGTAAPAARLADAAVTLVGDALFFGLLIWLAWRDLVAARSGRARLGG